MTSSRRRSRDATTSHYGRGTTAGPELSNTALGVPAGSRLGMRDQQYTKASSLPVHCRVFCCRGVGKPGRRSPNLVQASLAADRRGWGPQLPLRIPAQNDARPSPTTRTDSAIRSRLGSKIESHSVTRPGPRPSAQRAAVMHRFATGRKLHGRRSEPVVVCGKQLQGDCLADARYYSRGFPVRGCVAAQRDVLAG